MPPTTNGALPAADGPVTPTLAVPASMFDTVVMRSDFLALVSTVFGAPPDELSAQLFDADFAARVAAEDSGPLYVVKMKSESTHGYRITASHVTTIALVKHGVALDTLATLAQQLHFINLFGSDKTPYGSLHLLGGGKDGDSKMGG
ncbi:hypothetical protein DFH11DRAFT_1726677 [Phellopilus nigrolimitatus]|nr:hypothetical protein DFH11DRAFT_1726677 [Phellopilus nigrolimitatus]